MPSSNSAATSRTAIVKKFSLFEKGWSSFAPGRVGQGRHDLQVRCPFAIRRLMPTARVQTLVSILSCSEQQPQRGCSPKHKAVSSQLSVVGGGHVEFKLQLGLSDMPMCTMPEQATGPLLRADFEPLLPGCSSITAASAASAFLPGRNCWLSKSTRDKLPTTLIPKLEAFCSEQRRQHVELLEQTPTLKWSMVQKGQKTCCITNLIRFVQRRPSPKPCGLLLSSVLVSCLVRRPHCLLQPGRHTLVLAVKKA